MQSNLQYSNGSKLRQVVSYGCCLVDSLCDKRPETSECFLGDGHRTLVAHGNESAIAVSLRWPVDTTTEATTTIIIIMKNMQKVNNALHGTTTHKGGWWDQVAVKLINATNKN
jgi:hypothetical protein